MESAEYKGKGIPNPRLFLKFELSSSNEAHGCFALHCLGSNLSPHVVMKGLLGIGSSLISNDRLQAQHGRIHETSMQKAPRIQAQPLTTTTEGMRTRCDPSYIDHLPAPENQRVSSRGTVWGVNWRNAPTLTKPSHYLSNRHEFRLAPTALRSSLHQFDETYIERISGREAQ